MKERLVPGAFPCPAGVFCALALCMAAFVSCEKADDFPARDERARAQAVADYVDGLPDEQKISQLFLVNVAGDTAFASVEKTGVLFGILDDGAPLVPGGCLLFSYNIADTPEKVAAYTASVRAFYADNGIVPPYIAIDQEGGLVNRLRGITSNLVSQKKVTEWFSPERARELYAAQAKQLRLLGIQMNLAPVVEVETDENAAFLDTRSFGSLEQVLLYGQAAVSAYEENGIAVVLKHVPGNTNVDPHTGLPHVDIAESALPTYLASFARLAPFSSALLMSHIIARVIDDDGGVLPETDMPACFSSYWVQSVARSYGDGLIFSDDIFMDALAGNGYPPESAVLSAIDAGITCIMLSGKYFGDVALVLFDAYRKSRAADVSAAFAEKVDEAVRRVIAYKIKAGLLQYVPVLNEKGVVDDAHPAYIVVPNPGVPSFDKDAFAAAYAEGMQFYQ